MKAPSADSVQFVRDIRLEINCLSIILLAGALTMTLLITQLLSSSRELFILYIL
jgi:hypothetical protein